MRVLVLRAGPDAQRTARRLAALGHQPIVAPLIEIIDARAKAPAARFDALVATSSHGLENLDAGFDVLRQIPLFVVGERTASLARARGFLHVKAVARDATALLRVLLSHLGAGDSALYLAGLPRKPTIEIGLKRAGCNVEALVIYESRAADRLPRQAEAAVRAGEIDAALHYSRRSAALFLELVRKAGVEKQASELVHAVISNEACAPLRGFATRLRVAAKPEETDLLAALDDKT